jgi:hypothetical protein
MGRGRRCRDPKEHRMKTHGIERTAAITSPPTPPEAGDEIIHLLSRPDMTKTEGVKAFCGTELEPWSGGMSKGNAGRDDCVVCFALWDGGMR